MKEKQQVVSSEKNHVKKRQSQPLVLVLALVMLLAAVAPVAAQTPFTSVTQFQGVPGASLKIQDLQFTDIQGHWGAAAILEMAALGLFSGTGNRRFEPNRSVTYGEALTILLKARGQEEALRELQETQAPNAIAGVTIANAGDTALMAVVAMAQQENLLTPADLETITQLTETERETVEDRVKEGVDPYVTSQLTSAELTQLEEALRQQITTRAAWNRPASRQQVAVWLVRAANMEPAALGQTPLLNKFTDVRSIAAENRPAIEAILQAGYLSGTSATTFAPEAPMTRGQMAAAMQKARDAWMPFQGMTQRTGSVSQVRLISTGTSPESITRQITVKHPDGTSALITATPQADLMMLRETTLGLSDQVYEGDAVRWYENPNGTARLMVLAITETPPVLSGFLENVDPATGTVKIRDFNGREHQLSTSAGVSVTLNGLPSSLSQLPYGIEVTLGRTGNTVNRVEALLEEDPARHGYIAPESRFKVGDVLHYDGTSLTITAMSDGSRETYQISNYTRIEREGRVAQPFEIKNGDRVLLLFDDIYSPEIATIRVEDTERHITDLIRGTIASVDLRSREVVLQDITRFHQNRWVPHSDALVRYKAEDNTLYAGARPLTLQQLDRMTGSQIYAATQQSYGVPRIAKLQTQNGSAQVYDTRISQLEFATERLQADYNNFNFHEGTIVVHNNRLVDRLNLAEQQSVYLMAGLTGSGREAALIQILDQDLLQPRPGGTQLYLYLARLQDLYDYQADLGRLGYRLHYQRISDNQWEPLRGTRRAAFSDDTLIYDSDLAEKINPQVFLSTRYIDPQDIENRELRKRLEDRFYYDKAAYFVVRETTVGNQTTEEILAINLAPFITYESGSVLTEHSAMGSVSAVDAAAGTMTFDGLRQWNSLNRRWENAPGTETLNMEKAVLILNDEPISAEEIWRVRSGAQAFVIKNRTSSTTDTAYVVIVEQ